MSTCFKDYTITVNHGIKIHFKQGGKENAPPLLLLHGYPETHLIWHKIAPHLAEHFMLIMPDLRGYGDSSKPKGDPQHLTYSKHEMAKDMVELMSYLGHETFTLIAHDRGARVAHRLTRDYPARVKKLALMDMLPTQYVFENVNAIVAKTYYHWFLMIQEDGLPEKMIGECAHYYIQEKLKRWSGIGLNAFPPEVLSEYLRCSTTPEAIHAACEDYRAAASIDLEHDARNREVKVACPVLLLWAKNGLIGKHFKPIDIWQAWATDVAGHPMNCGHFIPEELPEETYQILNNWLKDSSSQ